MMISWGIATILPIISMILCGFTRALSGSRNRVAMMVFIHVTTMAPRVSRNWGKSAQKTNNPGIAHISADPSELKWYATGKGSCL